ncbi:MAG: serine/threonine protein kinase [Alphaproteobacteria bacterium]|nr:serine/threonine protein kinase [Alphaproteobacteria bacterium]MBV8409729.1 serine/threonine protein kinase [Alphaproteobacteria bacterium]
MEPLPATIGRYEVEALVGTGAMGRVFKANDPAIRRTVAIKLISTRLMSRSDADFYIRRFRREAEAAARCMHPNVVTIYDFALHEDEPFLAMEFVDGTSLRQLLDQALVMAVPDAVGLILQVLDALQLAHGHGVVHQDIKPANILVTRDGQAKVSDFGVSRIAGTETTTAQATAGTPAYMSPEQCRGEPVDGRADLFGVGAMLFEMVAGQRAFTGRTVTELSHRIQNVGLASLPAEVRLAAPRLQGVLERATAKARTDRFATAIDMAAALRQALDDDKGDDTRVQPRQMTAATAVSSGMARFDSDSLRQVEASLRPYIGPIAPMLVRDAANRSRSADELCAELARSLREGEERDWFWREVAPLLRRGAPAVVQSRPSDQELAQAQAALSSFVGPVAGHLVRQVASSASNADALWQGLAETLSSPAEQAAFLRQRKT